MKKYLIDIHHGLGDLIHIIPAIKALRDSDPKCWICLLVQADFIKDFIRSQEIVDEIIVLDRKNMIRNIQKMKHHFYDYGIIAPCIDDAKKASMMMRLFGCCRILRESDNEHSVIEHRVDKTNRLIGKIGIKVTEMEPRITLNTEGITFADKLKHNIDLSRKTIGICIGGTSSKYVHDGITEYIDVKRWPNSYWYELIKLLVDEFNVIMLGGDKEKKEFWGEYSASGLNTEVIDLLGKTSVMQSAGALSICDVVAGNDTGMIHVAAAIGRPTVTVYCSTNPKKIGAYAKNAICIDKPLDCKYCFLSEKTFACKDRRCVYQTKPQDFYEQIISSLV